MAYTSVWDAMQNQVSDQIIKRDEDGAFIPFDPDNVDYRAFSMALRGQRADAVHAPSVTDAR